MSDSRHRSTLSRRTETFVVRLWAEYLEQTPPIWRGEIQHVGSKEMMHFGNLSEISDAIRRCLQAQGHTHEQEEKVMSYQTRWSSIETHLGQLEAEGYRFIEAPDCVDRVLFKQARLGPRLKATVDITTATEPLAPPEVIYEHLTRWAKSLLGNNGMGVLVFEYYAPPIQVVNEIVKLGRGFLGGAQVVASVYDQATGEFWLWQPMQGTYSTKKFP